MVNFRHDYDLGGAHVGSTVHPHTLRFPGYNDPDYQNIVRYKHSIEDAIGKRIFVPDLRTHKGKVEVIDIPDIDQHLEVDAVVTQSREIAIALLTADCCPMLLHSPQEGVIGGIHGSKAAIVNGVIENTFGVLDREFGIDPGQVSVFVGQTICQSHYELPEDKAQGFQDINVRPGDEGKVLLDIRGESVYRLGDIGVSGKNIFSPEICTYGSSDKFSYRRKTHQKSAGIENPLHANNGNVIWHGD